MQTEMEQPLHRMSHAPQNFQSRLSRVRAWTLVPTFYGPMIAWAIIKYVLIKQGFVVSDYVALQVSNTSAYAALLVWWLVLAAPRPYSVRATMGRPLDIAGWGQVVVAALGVSCSSFIELLS